MADDVDNKTTETTISAGPVEAAAQTGKVLSAEELKKRNQRNLALAFGIIAFVIIVFLVTILRMGGNVAERAF